MNNLASINTKNTDNANPNRIVDVSYKKITTLKGTHLGEVIGTLDCIDNDLVSLEGSPREVKSYFDCSNNKLATLEGGPNKVGTDFYCTNNRLTNLRGSPSIIMGDFSCDGNSIITLLGGPKEVGGTFGCSCNDLQTLDWFPESVGGNFYCNNNPNLPRSELYRIVDRVKGDIYYINRLTPEDKYQLRRKRDISETLKHDELDNLDL